MRRRKISQVGRVLATAAPRGESGTAVLGGAWR
jgi:hypothetical protein